MGVRSIVAACIVAAGAASGQPPLLKAGQALSKIADQGILPECPDTARLRTSKSMDAQWLFNRLNQVGWDKVSQDYVLSLNDLADGLAKIGKAGKSEAACETLRLIVRDIHAKRQDCEVLGHSRTDIPVEIVTTMGQDPRPGLEVYTRWLPAGDRFTTAPKRLSELSTPARGTVPIPGEFEIFAKDPATGQASDPERVSIGGTETFRWPLPVRFSTAQTKK